MNIPALLERYIAVGLDPAAFWSLTPRMCLLHIKGAAQGIRERHALRAEAVWVGMHANQTELNRFMDRAMGRDTSLPPSALAGMLRSASAGLKTITMAEFLMSKGR